MAKYICKNNPAHTFTEPTADFWCPLCEKNTGMLELVDESIPPIEDDGKIDALEEEIELLKKENARLNEIRKEDKIKENPTKERPKNKISQNNENLVTSAETESNKNDLSSPIEKNPKVESENDKNFNHSNKVDFSSTSPKYKNILIYSFVIFVLILIITGIGVYDKFNGSNHSQDSTESTNPTDTSVPEASTENTSENKDSDGDGVLDKYDNCILEPGIVNGCPDNDNDGIINKVDACPEVAGNNPNGCFYFKEVTFKNKSNYKAYLSIAYNHENGWKCEGWYTIDPNESYTYTLPEKFDGKEVYWTAKVYDDTYSWQGKDRFFNVDLGGSSGFTLIDGKLFETGGGFLDKRGFYKLVLTSETTYDSFR